MIPKNLRRMPGKRKHMRKPKILVVGSLVMDQIATTRVFPRQGQTVLGERFDKAPGGKGSNQAVQAARLGAEVTMVGKLGRDANGEEMLNASRASGVHTEYIMLDDKTASGCCVIILEVQPDGSTQNRILVIPGANMAITPQDVEFLREEVANYDLVMLQLEIPMQINELVAGFAHAKGVPVMLNPAPSAPLSDELLRCLTFISPNEHEAEDLTGIHIRHEGKNINWQDVELAAKSLRDRGVKNVLITLGSPRVRHCATKTASSTARVPRVSRRSIRRRQAIPSSARSARGIAAVGTGRRFCALPTTLRPLRFPAWARCPRCRSSRRSSRS